MKILLFLFFFVLFQFSKSCDFYENCPKTSESSINLHIVAHTHDDVGWLKTPDQYYFGAKNSIQDAGVQYILDSVVQELINDRSKRFIYVETKFFWQWWLEQNESLKVQVRRLVENGQLEFIGGGWSMNDEATTHYQSIIDQFTWGFRRLNDTFGKCARPKIGWQIDPFGHSRTNAAIMSEMGFDGLFLGRIDWQDKLNRMNKKTMEMLWKTSPNNEGDLFTGVLYNTYSAPKGFCFDINCEDEPIIDNIKSPEYNANRKVAEFLEIMRRYSKAYKTNNILVTMGEDFMYMDAHYYFKNLDKLIKYINKIESPLSPFRAFYSTPSCYLKSVNDAGIKLEVKKDDFFPYSSDPNAFWTGFFTSRPTLKRFERIGNNFLQICKQLHVLCGLRGEDEGLTQLREAMGVMQHHDAITGTEKQHVAADYSRILTQGINECFETSKKSLRKLMNHDEVKYKNCLQLNISSCDVTENEDTFVVTIYNPLSRNVTRLVRLPIENFSSNYSVRGPKGEEIMTQTIPLPVSVLSLPGRKSKATAQLVFIADTIPALGFLSFYVSKSETATSFKSQEIHDSTNVGFENGLSLQLNEERQIVLKYKNNSETLLNYFYYKSAAGNNKAYELRSSGAYIFRPNSTKIQVSTTAETNTFEGPLVVEIHQMFTNWVSHIVRIFKNCDYVEYDWIVGPIPDEDKIGKEIVAVYKASGIHNNGEFYTDSNGRGMIKRVLNQRETWKLRILERVSGNYYPVTTSISIKDENKMFSVITDRAQGGSSLSDGTIELMLHRRLFHDDAFGVEEALNETAFGQGLVTRGSHYVSFANDNDKVKRLVQEKILDSWLFFSPTHDSFEDWKSKHRMEYSALESPIDEKLQILTLEPWKENKFLLRIENIMENGSATVDLKNLFKNFELVDYEEMMLGANVEVGQRRLKWNFKSQKPNKTKGPIFEFSPMQIRTFIVDLRPKF